MPLCAGVAPCWFGVTAGWSSVIAGWSGWRARAAAGWAQTFSEAAIRFCLWIKVLLWLPPVMQEVSDRVGV